MKEKQEVLVGRNIREIIFGLEDGAIGNLGVVVGLAQALAPNKLIILAGLATMLTQAISMSAGTYLSIKSEKEYFEVESKVREYGKEYSKQKNPVTSSLIMGFFVVLGAAIPLSVFFFLESKAGMIPSIIVTIIGLFLLGVLKSWYARRNWFISGLEIAIVGAIAAVAGYAIGNIFG